MPKTRVAQESPNGAVSRPRARPRPLPTATHAENQALGRLLYHLRLATGLSQRAFAHRLHITHTALARLERGAQTVPAALFWRLATSFHLPAHTLLRALLRANAPCPRCHPHP